MPLRCTCWFGSPRNADASIRSIVGGEVTVDDDLRTHVPGSEEDLAEASRKLQALAGTIGQTDVEALRERIAKSVKEKRLVVAMGRIELPTLRFSVVCSTN